MLLAVPRDVNFMTRLNSKASSNSNSQVAEQPNQLQG